MFIAVVVICIVACIIITVLIALSCVIITAAVTVTVVLLNYFLSYRKRFKFWKHKVHRHLE